MGNLNVALGNLKFIKEVEKAKTNNNEAAIY